MFTSRVDFLHYMLEQGWELVSATCEAQDTTWPSQLLFRRRIVQYNGPTDALKN